MWTFIAERREQLAFEAYQHASLVVQSVLLATVIAIALAVLVNRVKSLGPFLNTVSAIGLTIPSFALLGLLLPLVGIGVLPSVLAVTFYAVLPILRNAVVGLQGVDSTLVESARGMGMTGTSVLLRVKLPLSWPVILTGIRVSTQMSMGVAAIAAFALGPGLGQRIFTGLAQVGGANAINSVLVATVGIVILAVILDALLVLLGRLTTSKGIRV